MKNIYAKLNLGIVFVLGGKRFGCADEFEDSFMCKN